MSARTKHRESSTPEHSASAERQADTTRVDLALRSYLTQLGTASCDDDIYKALGQLGALLQMPHLELSCSSAAGGTNRRRTVYRSPDAKLVAKAPMNLPRYDWARDWAEPVSPSDAEIMLNSPARGRGPKRIEALAVNLEGAPDRTVHAEFFGAKGNANGLAKSLLRVGTEAACARHAKGFVHKKHAAPVTNRERQILHLAMSGLTDAGVARALGISARTVRFHMANAIRKAGVTTLVQLVAVAARQSGEHAPK